MHNRAQHIGGTDVPVQRMPHAAEVTAATVEKLTALHEGYARRAVELLVHGLPWRTFQSLADEVEQRVQVLLTGEQ